MTFPTIPLVAAGRVITAFQANATATRTFPDLAGLTKNSGDLLVAIVVGYQGSLTANIWGTWGGGFTEIRDTGTATQHNVGIAYKISTGAETGTFTVVQAATVTGHAGMIVMSIPGAHASAAPEVLAALAVATAASADPAALTPSWGAADTLWIAVGASGETSLSGAYTGMGLAAGPPTNYGNAVSTGESADVIGAIALAVAFRQLNAASEDVGTWSSADLSNARNAAIVIAVRPSINVAGTLALTGTGKTSNGFRGPTAVFACGFECATISTHWTPTNAVFDTTVSGRNGARAARLDFAGTPTTYLQTGVGSGPPSSLVVRLRFRMSALPTSIVQFMYLGTTVGAAPTFFLNQLGVLSYNFGNGTGDSATGAIVADRWYTLQFWADGVAKTAGWMLDGVTQPSPANATQQDTFTALNIGKSDGIDHGTYSMYVDDAVISQTLGDYPIADGYVAISGTESYVLTPSGVSLVLAGTLAVSGTGTISQTPKTLTGYAAVVASDSPVSYWRLGEPSGTVAADTLGASPGTYTGSPTLGSTGAITGDADTAVDFNGTTQYVTVPDAAALDLGNTLSIEVWVKRARSGAIYEQFVNKGTGAYALQFYNNDRVYIVRGDIIEVAHSSITITDTNWHHIVGTKDASGGKVYIDGVDVTVADTNATLTDNANALIIGAYRTGASEFFQGSIDEVAVYSTALSAARVLAHYSAGAGSVTHQGTLAVSGAGTLAQTGADSLAGGFAVTGTAAMVRSGSLLLSSTLSPTGAGTLGQTGSTLQPGALAVSGVGTIAPTGSTRLAGAQAVTGTGLFALSGALTITAALAVTGTGTGVRAGSATYVATLAATGTGALLEQGSIIQTAVFAVSGSGAVTQAPTETYAPIWSPTGVGTLGQSGTLIGATVYQQGTLALTGTGVAAQTGTAILAAALATAGAGTLTASSDMTRYATLSAVGSGVGSFTGMLNLPGSLATSGNGVYGSTGSLWLAGGLSATGTGAFGSSGSVSSGSSLTVAGGAALGAAGTLRQAGAASVVGTGSFVETGSLQITGAAAFTGAGSTVESGQVFRVSALSVTGTGSFGGSGALSVASSLAWTGTGALGADGMVARPGTASFFGSGSWAGSGNLAAMGTAAFAGAGSWSGTGGLFRGGAWSGTGTGVLSGATRLIVTGQIAVAGAGMLLLQGSGRVNATANFGGSGTFAGYGMLVVIFTGMLEPGGLGAADDPGFALEHDTVDVGTPTRLLE